MIPHLLIRILAAIGLVTVFTGIACLAAVYARRAFDARRRARIVAAPGMVEIGAGRRKGRAA